MLSALRAGGRVKAFTLLLVGMFVLGVLLAGCAPKAAPPPKEEPKKEEPKPEPPKEPLVIGASIDISGRASTLGTPQRDTYKMLEETINAAGGINGRPVKTIIYDNESDETKHVLAVKKLIEEDKVPVVLGASTSGPSVAAVKTAMEAKVPVISHAASVAIVTPVEERTWVFKTAQHDDLVGSKVAEWLKKQGWTKIGFISEGTAWGESGRGAFERAAARVGLNVVAWEKFGAQDTDMTAQLTRIRGFNPDAVVFWAIPPGASVVTKNYRALGMKPPLIGSHGIGNMAYIEQSGADANDVIFPIGKLVVADALPDTDPQKRVLVEYKRDFKAKFGYEPSTFGGHGWDGWMIAVEALKAVGPDRAKIRDYVENLKGFVGITGVFNFSKEDHTGLGPDSLVWVKIVDGKWTFLEP